MIFSPFAYRQQVVSSTPGIVTSGLICYYDVNNPSSYGGTGTAIYDLSGNGNTGTLLNGPTYVSGPPSYLSFDGVNDGLDSNTFGPSNTCSFGGWIQRTNDASSYVNFFRRGLDGSGDGWSAVLYLEPFSPWPINVYVAPGGGGGGTSSTQASTINTWYYGMGVYDQSASTLKLYINGTLVQTVTATGNFRTSGFGWQAFRTNTTVYDPGRMGDFQLYNRAISATEITTNWNAKRSVYGY
jgi:hypothetical protein